MPSLLALALAAAPRSRATTAALDPPGAVIHPTTTVAASATVALLGERPALCPSGAVGWLNLTAVCCDASCGECSASACHTKGAPPHAEPPRSACCAPDILRAGVPCARPTDTSCVGVAAESVAAALGDDAARAQAARAALVADAALAARAAQRLRLSGRSEQAGAPPRILGLTSSSCRPSDANARLLGTLRRACERYPGLKLIVNLFDLSKDEAEAAGGCWLGGGAGGGGQGGDDVADRPSCLARVTHLPGHKATFWRDVAPAEEVRKDYDYVFAFDNDMRIADDGFDLERAASLLKKADAGMGQPRVKVVERPSMASAISLWRTGSAIMPNGTVGTPLDDKSYAFLSDPLPAGCDALLLEFCENQAPLFTSRAWAAVHTIFLSHLDEKIFRKTNWGISNTWCRVVERYSAHARGCVLVDEQLATTDERTIEALNLSSAVRNSGGGAFGFVAAQWPLEYIGATGGHYARGECVASSG